MTNREYRLRRHIDTLNDRADFLRDLLTREAERADQAEARARARDVRQLQGRKPFACVYCGTPAYFRACVAHRDLVDIDPFFSDGDLQ